MRQEYTGDTRALPRDATAAPLHGTAAVDELKSRGREASDSKVPPFPAGCILLADAPSEDGYLGRAPPRFAVVCAAHTLGMENHALYRSYRRGAFYTARSCPIGTSVFSIVA